jgi:hypothetical protein
MEREDGEGRHRLGEGRGRRERRLWEARGGTRRTGRGQRDIPTQVKPTVLVLGKVVGDTWGLRATNPVLQVQVLKSTPASIQSAFNPQLKSQSLKPTHVRPTVLVRLKVMGEV